MTHEEIAKFSPTYSLVQECLRETMQTFLETGIVVINAAWDDKSRPSLINGSQLRSYMRMVAKEMNRPFIYARTTTRHPYIHVPAAPRRIVGGTYGRYVRDKSTVILRQELVIPCHERFHPLIAPLLLVAERTRCRYTGEDNKVSVFTNTTTHSFDFSGEYGETIFKNFFEQCRTDPVFRVILGANAKLNTKAA